MTNFNNFINSHNRIVMIILSLFFLDFITAQNNFKYPLIQNHRKVLKTIKEDFKYIMTSPLRMSKKDHLHLLIASGITSGFVFYLDDIIDKEYVINKKKPIYTLGNKIAGIGKEYGRSNDRVFYLFGGITTSLYAGGIMLKNKKLLHTTGLISESFLFSLLISGSTKLILGRSRPYMNKGSKDFNFFSFSDNKDFRSMPSVHTSSAFSMITVITKQYDYWWVKVPSYGFLTGVIFQRIHDHKHWASDVIIGGLIGYSVANILLEKYDRKNTASLSLHPFISTNRFGVYFYFN